MMNNPKSELGKMTESVSKTIVDNINNVLGILPRSLNFEVNTPKKRAHRAKPRAKTSKKRSMAAKGGHLKRRAKAKVVQLKTAAKRKRAAVKGHKRKSSRTAKAA
jgi:hypothetical protein